MISVVLLVLGLFLILLEFYLPGANRVFWYIAYAYQHCTLCLSIAVALGYWFICFYCYRLFDFTYPFALWRIVRAKPGYSIYLHGDQKGYMASSFDATAIGKTVQCCPI